jgi:uncharacterized membrane protein
MEKVRVAGLDIVRGVVMVLMAIDHVRVYSGVPAGGPSAGVFFTRWVTHFCAPVFVFLAGTAAFLHLRKIGDRGALARYLLVRGLMLVVLEMTVIKAAWTFNVDYSSFLLAGVIWMLGWCMVLMAGLIWLPTWAVGVVGLLVIAGQNLAGTIGNAAPFGPSMQWLWQFLYLGGEVRIGAGGPSMTVLYTIIPWIGVMAAGYAFGAIVVRERTARDAIFLRVGVAATVLFIVGAGVSTFSLSSDDSAPALMQMLNQRKYPASPLFLLMTLGPSIALLPAAERARADARWTPIADVFGTFGRVPLFYYLLHIPLIHATALIVWFLRDGVVNAQRFSTAPYVSLPEPERWGLPLLYLVFVVVVVALYFPCRRYARFKAEHSRGVTRYL